MLGITTRRAVAPTTPSRTASRAAPGLPTPTAATPPSAPATLIVGAPVATLERAVSEGAFNSAARGRRRDAPLEVLERLLSLATGRGEIVTTPVRDALALDDVAAARAEPAKGSYEVVSGGASEAGSKRGKLA